MEKLRQSSGLSKATATGGNYALTPQEPRHFAAPTACRVSRFLIPAEAPALSILLKAHRLLDRIV